MRMARDRALTPASISSLERSMNPVEMRMARVRALKSSLVIHTEFQDV